MESFSQMQFFLAFAACTLVSVATALLGVTLVLRRLSYMGDGLSHIAFGAMAVATVCGLSGHLFLATLPLVAIASLFLLNSRSRIRLRADAALAMMISASLAAGYLLRHFHEAGHHDEADHADGCCDVCTTLFGSGSLLDLSSGDVWLSLAVSALVVAFFVLFRRRIFAVSFDPDFALTCGIRVGWWESALAVLSAVAILLAMKVAGTLLVSALVVFPVAVAMRFSRSFASTLVLSAAVAAAMTAAGLSLAAVCSTPPGPTIVVLDALVYLAAIFLRPAR